MSRPINPLDFLKRTQDLAQEPPSVFNQKVSQSLDELRIIYHELPPTSNKIYFRGTILTKRAREYAERFSEKVARDYLHLINRMDPTAIYMLEIYFFFPLLINPTFNDPKTPEKRRAKTRYKKIDLTNRIKLLEDCVRDAIAIDDSQTFAAIFEKHQDPANPRVEIVVRKVEPSSFGI